MIKVGEHNYQNEKRKDTNAEIARNLEKVTIDLLNENWSPSNPEIITEETGQQFLLYHFSLNKIKDHAYVLTVKESIPPKLWEKRSWDAEIFLTDLAEKESKPFPIADSPFNLYEVNDTQLDVKSIAYLKTLSVEQVATFDLLATLKYKITK